MVVICNFKVFKESTPLNFLPNGVLIPPGRTWLLCHPLLAIQGVDRLAVVDPRNLKPKEIQERAA